MINFFYLFLRRGISYYHVHDHSEKKNLLEFFRFTPFSLYIYIDDDSCNAYVNM